MKPPLTVEPTTRYLHRIVDVDGEAIARMMTKENAQLVAQAVNLVARIEAELEGEEGSADFGD